jgi:hypothetical protein
MRFSEIATLPGTPSEAKNAILDLMTVYQGKNINEVPLDVIMKMLHRQDFDVDRRLVIDLIKNEPNVKRISSGTVYLNSEDDELDAVSKDEEEKSKETVKKMAKKALKKEIGE